ncbi:MAG: hypothetical protein WCT22_02485 [Patescibacteria group bacterium]|jgi:hypothetical protein
MEISLILNIAGFNIKINFHHTQWDLLYKLKQKEIKKNLAGFINKGKPEKIDYEIAFLEASYLRFIKKKVTKRYYINLFEEVSNRKIITYYQISFVQFQVILRMIINILLKNQGFIIHASASNIKGKALLFLGKSGAGKSTTMKFLNHKYQSLADDTVIIKKENSNYFFYQTPFIEKEAWVKKTNKRYGLGSIFFIKKAKFFKKEKISDKNKILNLLIKQLWTNDENDIKNKTAALFKYLYQSGNFFYLYLKKNSKQMINYISRL